MKIVSHICGGLGNQLFQYAHGRALSIKHNCALELDIHWFENYGKATPRTFQLDRFPMIANSNWAHCSAVTRKKLKSSSLWMEILSKLLCKRKVKKSYILETESVIIENVIVPCYLEGYWQNEAYFAEYRDIILKDLTFPALGNKAQSLAETISIARNSVSLHVRAGDYLTNESLATAGICSLSYYEKAVNYIKQHYGEVDLFVFSDDVKWAQSNLSALQNDYTLIDVHGENDGIHDMHLMSLCKHHIIVNSSFSWWGAWLSPNEGITVCPTPWVLDPTRSSFRPAPSEWHKISMQ